MNKADEPRMPPPAAHWSERAGLWGYLLFLAVFGSIMAPRVSNIAGGADPSCYLELSRCFMDGSLHPPMRPVAGLPLDAFGTGLYAPISFEPLPDYSGLVPTGFTGLPLLYSFFDLFLPTPVAIGLTGWLTMMGCGVVPFLLLRAIGFGNAWAAFGGITAGLSPLVVLIGSVPMTDPLTCCLAAACWLLALNAERGRGWAAALGFVLGFAVLTRLSNVLLFPAMAAYLLLHGWRRVSWAAIVAGGAPAAVFLLLYNQHVSVVSGYGNVLDLLNPGFLPGSLGHYLQWLNMLFFPAAIVFAPFSLLFIGRDRAIVASAWLLIAAYTVFYGSYFASTETWFILRYIMPAIVAIIAASVLVLQRSEGWIVRRWNLGRFRGILPVILALAALAHGIHHGSRMRAYDFKKNESVILDVVDWLEQSTRADDVFLCFNFSGSLHYYTDRAFLRHERLDPASWEKLVAAVDEETIYGIFYAFEMGDPGTVAGKFPGAWEQVFITHDGAIRVFRLTKEPAVPIESIVPAA